MLALSCTDEGGTEEDAAPDPCGLGQAAAAVADCCAFEPACLGSSCLREQGDQPTKSPLDTPLIDFPEGGVLDPFHLLGME